MEIGEGVAFRSGGAGVAPFLGRLPPLDFPALTPPRCSAQDDELEESSQPRESHRKAAAPQPASQPSQQQRVGRRGKSGANPILACDGRGRDGSGSS